MCCRWPIDNFLHMTKRLIFSFALILLLTIAAQATTVERLTLDDLVKKSQQIVVGKVRDSRTYWSGNGKLIFTSYTIEVQENLKGRTSRTVELTTIGGTMGDVTLHVAGMPAFNKGESAVVFIETTGVYSTVVGLGQGKFTVTHGEVSNSVSDLAFPDGRPGKSLKMTLDSFKQEIKTLVGR